MPLLQAGSSTLNYPFKIGREKSLNLRSSSSSYFTCAKAHARLSFCAPIRAFSIASNMRSSSLGYKYRHGSKKNRQEMSRQKKKKSRRKNCATINQVTDSSRNCIPLFSFSFSFFLHHQRDQRKRRSARSYFLIVIWR